MFKSRCALYALISFSTTPTLAAKFSPRKQPKLLWPTLLPRTTAWMVPRLKAPSTNNLKRPAQSSTRLLLDSSRTRRLIKLMRKPTTRILLERT